MPGRTGWSGAAGPPNGRRLARRTGTPCGDAVHGRRPHRRTHSARATDGNGHTLDAPRPRRSHHHRVQRPVHIPRHARRRRTVERPATVPTMVHRTRHLDQVTMVAVGQEIEDRVRREEEGRGGEEPVRRVGVDVRRAGRQGRPPDVAVAVTPVHPGSRPRIAGHPDPARAVDPDPTAVMEHGPREGPAAVEQPAGGRVHPLPATRVGLEARADDRRARLPDPAVAVGPEPTAIGRERVIERSRDTSHGRRLRAADVLHRGWRRPLRVGRGRRLREGGRRYDRERDHQEPWQRPVDDGHLLSSDLWGDRRPRRASETRVACTNAKRRRGAVPRLHSRRTTPAPRFASQPTGRASIVVPFMLPSTACT